MHILLLLSLVGFDSNPSQRDSRAEQGYGVVCSGRLLDASSLLQEIMKHVSEDNTPMRVILEHRLQK